jgi:predicted DNA-binding transcriptional regulator AlpA
MESVLTDDNALIGMKKVREFLNNISAPTFYRHLKDGIIPQPRYLGRTPLWRLSEIHALYDKLPEESNIGKERIARKSSYRSKCDGHSE